ncbi:DUF1616 domain-containing protein [Chloroflexota bacterium]
MEWLSPIRGLFDFVLPVLDKAPIIRGVIGFVLVFLLPGFAWTLIFFKEINNIERLCLSFALSIAIVTLSTLGLNILFGMRITGFNALMVICMVTTVPIAIYYIRKRILRRKDSTQ